MIIRIMGEGQYRLDGTALPGLTELDELVVGAIDAGDDEAFHAAFAELLGFVEEHGTRVANHELVVSDQVLPHRDTTAAEARAAFADTPVPR